MRLVAPRELLGDAARDAPRAQMRIETYSAERHGAGAIAAVCAGTADDGSDGAARLDDDPDVVATFYATAYVDERLQPAAQRRALVLVDADDGSVVGYCLATLDSAAFVAACRAQFYPTLVTPLVGTPLLAPAVVDAARFDARLTFAESLRVAAARDLRGVAPIDALQARHYAQYPAHLHIDVLPRAQGAGRGAELLAAMLAALRDAGVAGVHLVAAAGNARARALYERFGFALLELVEGDCVVMGKAFQRD